MFDLIAFGCNTQEWIISLIITLILSMFIRFFAFGDTFSRTVGETMAWVGVSMLIWLTAKMVSRIYGCSPVFPKKCEDILKDAVNNKCTQTDLPKTIIL